MSDEMEEILETFRLPEPQRKWVVELLDDLIRQRDECMARNLVRLQTDMGPCQFIPKDQADGEIKSLQTQNATFQATAELVERAGQSLERRNALWKEPTGFGTRVDSGRGKIIETYHDTLREAIAALGEAEKEKETG